MIFFLILACSPFPYYQESYSEISTGLSYMRGLWTSLLLMTCNFISPMALCGAGSSTIGPTLSTGAALKLCTILYDVNCALQVNSSTTLGFVSPFFSAHHLCHFWNRWWLIFQTMVSHNYWFLTKVIHHCYGHPSNGRICHIFVTIICISSAVFYSYCFDSNFY